MFALYLIKAFVLGVLSGKKDTAKQRKKRLEFFAKHNKYVMIYNFMHRDISKEAFILYITSLIGALEV